MRYSMMWCCFIAVLFTSCTDKNYGVEFDDELVPFIESFKSEAALRGIEFNNNEEKIEGYLQRINVNGVAGLCRRHDEGRNRSIIVDKTYWNQANDLEREYVVYHELGHCFLLRDHQDEPDSIGNCQSIMYSGLDGCRINYTNDTREHYLDELFGK